VRRTQLADMDVGPSSRRSGLSSVSGLWCLPEDGGPRDVGSAVRWRCQSDIRELVSDDPVSAGCS
jgi:hypothetical protein